jgi:mannose-6-phosphate isomerase
MKHKTTSATGLAQLRDWFAGAALPFWAQHGYDALRGGFYEALNFDGTPSVGRPRRVRTQARQIHTFSQAGLRGWHDGAEELAAKGFDYFLDKACLDGGARGCVHHLADDGSALDGRRDLYDQAFLLLACASRWQAAKDDRALALAEKTVDFLNRELASPHGGWVESDAKELPRRQNPHMHLFEAFMALYRATGLERYLGYADSVYDLFCSAFYDAEFGVIREFFDNEWRPVDDADTVEPGHMLEWVWLLDAYEALGRTTPLQIRERLYERATTLGADPDFMNFIDNTSGVVTTGRHGPKRLWPQTEALRASLAMARHGSAPANARAEALAGAFFRSYLAVDIKGLWIDEFDGAGKPAAPDVPASILYHLFEAVAETDRCLSAAGKA